MSGYKSRQGKSHYSVQSLGHVRLFATPWTEAHQASLFFTISQSLFKLISIESVMPSNHLVLCHPLLLLPSTFPSIRVFSNESVLCIRWPTYLSFSFSISLSNEYSGLTSFRIDWFDPPCNPRDSQESSPAPQFKSSNSLVLSCLEISVWSLGWENPLEKGMATHFSILAWRIPWTEKPGKATVHGVAKSWTQVKRLSMHAQLSLWSNSHICTWLLEKS